MSGDVAALAARALLALWALASGVAILAGPRSRRPRRLREEAPPPRASREGTAALADTLRAAADGSFARERAAARMAALARDVIALELGLDDDAARMAARSGALDSSPALRDYIERDYLVEPRERGRRRGGYGDDFLDKTRNALNELEKLREARRGEQ